MSPARRLVAPFIIMVFLAVIPSLAGADEVQLNPDHPDRYTVKKGDTLWDISAKFLKSPWLWPKIWRVNEQIKNPHLIYPGDVIVLRWVEGKPVLTVERGGEKAPGAPPAPGAPAPAVTEEAPPPVPGMQTVKLEPQVRVESLDSAIPTIPPDAIAPFLNQPIVVGQDELDKAGYVSVGLDNRLALGNGSEFYARGLKGTDAQYFQIFRPGKAIRDPGTNELLAYEAVYLGDARMLVPGDPAKLVVTRVKQEISPADRLLAVTPKAAVVPYFFPHAPAKPARGYIVGALNAVTEVGPYTMVTLSLGERDGMEQGDVLRVMRHVGRSRDPVTEREYKLPDEESGLVMVFRTFEKVSYALVMSATQPVHIDDMVVTP